MLTVVLAKHIANTFVSTMLNSSKIAVKWNILDGGLGDCRFGLWDTDYRSLFHLYSLSISICRFSSAMISFNPARVSESSMKA